MPTAASKPRIKVLDSTLRWGSHRPVLRTLFDLFRPQTVLELGVGESSTSFLHALAPTLVSVENHAPWLGKIAGRLPGRDGFFPRHHPLLDHAGEEVLFSTLERDVPAGVLEGAGAFYRGLVREFGRFDLVLVDQAAATRRTSLEVLAPHADLIVIHDTEVCGVAPTDTSFDCYAYNRFFASPAAAAFHHLRFDAISPWSDALIRRSLPAATGATPALISEGFNAAAAAYLAEFPGSPPAKARPDYSLASGAASAD